MKSLSHGWMMLIVTTFLLLSTTPAIAQDHGGGGIGCGDVFGDLIHVLRDVETGQPILQKRWVEMPAEEPGYGWGYCVIAVDEHGEELGFAPLSCDVNEDDLDEVVEVNYFGRLNGGRTKERNHRMHFNEVISNIKAADLVQQDPTGRLMMGFDCKDVGMPPCDEWSTVDSPMESMALYKQLMKYGHLATDPYEIDTWAHGDPKLGTQFHPALSAEDFEKFPNNLSFLLPDNGSNSADCWDYTAHESFTDTDNDGDWDPAEPFIDINKNGEWDSDFPSEGGEPFTDLNDNGQWDDAEPFTDLNGNGVPDAFTFRCADPESLDNKDFVRGAILLGAAANKTGKVTVDLVQYWNRTLKITKKTATTEATKDTLPARVRVCEIDGGWQEDPDGEDQVEPPYTDNCVISDADEIEPENYDFFPDVQELFVDFAGLNDYEREDEEVKAIINTSASTWELAEDVSLLEWVEAVHPDDPATSNIDGFVAAASDALRSIEFVHNFKVPVNLYCVYGTSLCGD